MRKFLRRKYHAEWRSKKKAGGCAYFKKWVYVDNRCRDSYYLRELQAREIENWHPRLAMSKKEAAVNNYNNRLRVIKRENSIENDLNIKRRGLKYPRN